MENVDYMKFIESQTDKIEHENIFLMYYKNIPEQYKLPEDTDYVNIKHKAELSASEVFDLIDATLSQAEAFGQLYNPYFRDLILKVNWIRVFSMNLTLPLANTFEELMTLVDNINKTNLFELTEKNAEQFTKVSITIDSLVEKAFKQQMSFSNTVQDFINKLPENMETMQATLNDFDINKYKEVIEFAKSVNNGQIG